MCNGLQFVAEFMKFTGITNQIAESLKSRFMEDSQQSKVDFGLEYFNIKEPKFSNKVINLESISGKNINLYTYETVQYQPQEISE